MTARRGASHAVRGIKNHKVDRGFSGFVSLDGDNPVVQFASRDAYQTACCLQPERISTVSNHPVNHIAGQSVPAGHSGYTAVFQTAETALGRRPERAVPIEVQK